MKVLIIEENMVQRKLVSKFLEENGHQVSEFSEGVSALEDYKTGDYDLVLLDWHLPDVSGVAISRDIQEFNNISGKNCYIIMISSNKDIDNIMFAIDQGINDFITKPIDKELLMERIDIAKRFIKEKTIIVDTGSFTNPIMSLMKDHTYLRAVTEIFNRLCNESDVDINLDVLQQLSKHLLILEVSQHHGKEKIFMDHFLEVLSQSTNAWFEGISNTAFVSIHEQHDELESLFSDLQGFISVYVEEQREKLYLLIKTINQFELSIKIEDEISEVEEHIKSLKFDIDIYVDIKRRNIAPIKESARKYNELLANHIKFEDEKFFPFATKYLSDDDLHNIGQKFDTFEAEIGEDKIMREKEELLDYIYQNIIKS